MAYFSVEAQNIAKWYSEYQQFINEIQSQQCQNVEAFQFKVKLESFCKSSLVNDIVKELICKPELSFGDRRLFHLADIQVRKLHIESLKYWSDIGAKFIHKRLNQPFAFYEVIKKLPYKTSKNNRIYELPPELAYQTLDPPKISDKFILL